MTRHWIVLKLSVTHWTGNAI